jgi:hypothetical protein
LLAFSVAALAAAALFVFLALRPGPDPAAAVLDVEDAVATVVPSTVPPLATLPPAAPTTTAPEDDSTGPTTTTVPLSPLAELVGERGSAIPPDIQPRLRPVGLRIDEIFVDDPVVEVGLEEDGEFEVPGAEEIGWYRYGAAPGYPGATVLAAHVTWNGEYGPFLNLGELEPGDRVEVDLEDGSARVYEVTERTMYDKDGLPRDRIWRNTGAETLVLITCGGDFNPDISRYRQNIVVYAVPVA